MLNKNVGSFTFSWELIFKENLLRGLISRLYLDIVAGVRQERELFRSYVIELKRSVIVMSVESSLLAGVISTEYFLAVLRRTYLSTFLHSEGYSLCKI